MTAGADLPGRLLLLRNYCEERQPSMKYYGDLIAELVGPHLPEWCLDSFLPAPLSGAWRALPGKISNWLGRYLFYSQQVKKLRATLFHILDHGNAALLDHLPPERTVITCHDLILLKMDQGYFGKRRPPRVAWHTFHRALKRLNRAAAVITPSASTAGDLCRAGLCPRERIEIVPHICAADYRRLPESERQEARRELAAADDSLLLSVGTHNFYKNPEGVLQLLARLKAAGRQVRLVRVGPPLTPEQRRLAERLGVSGLLQELGLLSSRARLNRIYNACDLLLFPSLYEGFGWPVAEAQACGLPFICSDRGSLTEVADPQNCFPLEDIAGMARQAERLLDDAPFRQEQIAGGLARHARRDPREWGRRMSAIYRRLALYG